LGDSGTGVDPSASEVVVSTDSFFDRSCPFIAVSDELDDTIGGVDESPSVKELTVVVDFDKFLIVVCKSDRSCCKARLNLSSLSSLISNCLFSFSKSL